MNDIGEIKTPKELGRRGSNKLIWHACIDCGKERWKPLRGGKPESLRCLSCSNKRKRPAWGENNGNWRGGKRIDNGYISIKLQPSDFFYSMCDSRGYVGEHRLIVAKALGRNLHRWEIVHHKGAKYPKGSIENKQDNRYPENLQLVTEERHQQITILENQILHLKRRVTLLEAEAVLLRGIQGVLR